MTLPTPDEAKRAAETLKSVATNYRSRSQTEKRLLAAITLPKAYAAGELVKRPACQHLSTYTTDDGCGSHIVLCQACGETL